MEQLLAYIVELRARTTDLKRMIAFTQGDAGDKLREGVYQLEAAIHVMERNAADAYRAQTMKGEAKSA